MARHNQAAPPGTPIPTPRGEPIRHLSGQLRTSLATSPPGRGCVAVKAVWEGVLCPRLGKPLR